MIKLDYKFFDHKNEIEDYAGQDMFGTEHLVFMFAAFAVMILFCIFAGKISHEGVSKYLKAASIFVPVIDWAKIIWESYYDVVVYDGSLNLSGLIPIYACSLFVYTLPFAAWGKGKAREIALSFLGTLCIFFGLTNFIYLNVLNTYPFFTYASFTSAVFHFLMVFTGVLIISTGYWRPTWKAAIQAEIVILLYSAFVGPINYYLNDLLNVDYVDYCFLYSGKSCPVILHDIYKLFGEGLRPLYTVTASLCYTVPAFVFAALAIGAAALKKRFGNKALKEN